MFYGAYQAYSLRNTVAAGTEVTNLTPYMNYVRVDTTSTIDNIPAYGSTVNCGSGTNRCLRMHNGGILLYDDNYFDGMNTTNYIWMLFDPDGQASTVKGVCFNILYNGRVTSEGALASIQICDSSGCETPTAGYDPSWFNWKLIRENHRLGAAFADVLQPSPFMPPYEICLPLLDFDFAVCEPA